MTRIIYVSAPWCNPCASFKPILKEVTASCPKCKMEVAKRLSQITGIVEPIEIIEEVSGI